MQGGLKKKITYRVAAEAQGREGPAPQGGGGGVETGNGGPAHTRKRARNEIRGLSSERGNTC
jgi:hypothetical protein